MILPFVLGGCISSVENSLQQPAQSEGTTKAQSGEVKMGSLESCASSDSLKILPLPREFVTSQEDLLIVEVLDALNTNKLSIAKEKFIELYKMTHKRDYLIEGSKIALGLNSGEDVLSHLDGYLKKNSDDIEVARLLIGAYLSKKEVAKIKPLLGQMMNMKLTMSDGLFVGDMYSAINDYEKAIKAYKIAYSQKPTDQIAAKIATLLAEKLDCMADAISFYETHIRFYGCTKNICRHLSSLYAQVGDIENVISVERKIFSKYKDSQVANRVVSLYLAQNNIDGLIDFLKKSKFDDQILYEAYKVKKDYPNAAKIAMQLYEKTKDVHHLGQASIMNFEYGDKDDQALVTQTIKNLRIVVAKIDDELYLNYLGYLLIDYGISLNEGVELVKKAIEKDGDNAAYLDSLAWGLYKQKKCKEAYEIIIKVRSQMNEDKTVKSHFEIIKKCYNKEAQSQKTLRDIIK